MKLREHFSISARALKHLYSLNKSYFSAIIMGDFLSAAMPYIPIYFSAKILDGIFDGTEVKTLVFYALFTVLLTFALSMCKRALSAKENITSSAMYRSEQWMYSEKAMEMAYESIESHDTVALRDRIKKETQTGFNLWFLIGCIRNAVGNITKIISSVVLSFTFFLLPSVSLVGKLLIVSGLVVNILYGLFSVKKGTEINNSCMDACVDANVFGGKFIEYTNDYNSGKDIRTYDMAAYLARTNKECNKKLYNLFWKANLKQLALYLPDSFLMQGLKYGIYLILILAALGGGITVGSIAKYVTCLMMLCQAVASLAETMSRSFCNHTYLKRYFSYFDIPNNMYGGTLTVEKRDDNEYFVEFRNVSFKYPNTEAYALQNINFKFKVGEKLAIVGMNGSGKTTFIKLLCRLYDPTEGEILLNGVNIKKYDYDEYMSILSVVFQDFRLFAFTLGENVATSSLYDRQKAAECLRKAGFGERLSTLSDGLDTYLYKNYSKNGIEISGGEAQKIALARALYKDAPFIVLDEPTASLDPVSEYEIYSKFNEIVGDKTAIYISHRLASCRFCDTIAVFDKGELVQSGRHETLLGNENGKYAELWNAQARYYTDKTA